MAKKINDFVLNKEPYKNSSILLTGKNFGCGSSREHAPWALLDFGIKCVISPSFADIFYNNCFKNGMLPIILDENKISELIHYAERKENIEVNLTEQEINYGNNKIKFETFEVKLESKKYINYSISQKSKNKFLRSNFELIIFK